MTRLIDANKLKMYFDTCQFCEKCPDIAFMCQRSCEFPNILTPQWERAIDEQPTVDAVPVVRCKDCKYSKDEYGDGDCYCDLSVIYIGKDWNHFCSWAERKEE